MADDGFKLVINDTTITREGEVWCVHSKDSPLVVRRKLQAAIARALVEECPDEWDDALEPILDALDRVP